MKREDSGALEETHCPRDARRPRPGLASGPYSCRGMAMTCRGSAQGTGRSRPRPARRVLLCSDGLGTPSRKRPGWWPRAAPPGTDRSARRGRGIWLRFAIGWPERADKLPSGGFPVSRETRLRALGRPGPTVAPHPAGHAGEQANRNSERLPMQRSPTHKSRASSNEYLHPQAGADVNAIVTVTAPDTGQAPGRTPPPTEAGARKSSS